MKINWNFNEDINVEKITELSSELNISFILASVLVKRGIDTFNLSKDFFRPSLDKLHNPYLMKNMDLASKRVAKAIRCNEKIMIYGDYDVDGTTSVAMMYSFLSKYTKNVIFYIPDRYKEGYGVSKQGIDYAYSNHINLVITLDCGIKATEKINYAKDLKIDFIICDHHLPGKTLPDAIILNPKQNDCNYPFKELSGCGVGFKLIQSLLLELNEDDSLAFEYLDLLAISIASDIVPINGENRILSYYGLEKINISPSVGVSHIISNHKNKNKMKISDVVFGIAPKINAAGRMGSATNAVDLLLSKQSDKAIKLSEFISQDNENRRLLDKQILEESVYQIKEKNEEDKVTTLVYNDNWHKGVIGIVASRLIELYYRPTIVFTKVGDEYTGSARSVKGYDIYKAIESCSSYLTKFGGHKYACGLSLNEKNIKFFKKEFNDYVEKTLPKELRTPSIEIDGEIGFSELKKEKKEIFPKLYRILRQFAPFGPKNPNPIFLSRDVEAIDIRKVGDNHLKLRLKQQKSGVVLDAIAFQFGYLFDEINIQPFHVVYHIEENYWNQKYTLQLNVKDIKFGQIN